MSRIWTITVLLKKSKNKVMYIKQVKIYEHLKHYFLLFFFMHFLPVVSTSERRLTEHYKIHL